MQEVEGCRERLSMRDQEILLHLTHLRDLVGMLHQTIHQYDLDSRREQMEGAPLFCSLQSPPSPPIYKNPVFLSRL